MENLEKWPGRNLMRLNKSKWKILYQNNPIQIIGICMESSIAENGLKVLADRELRMNQQSVCEVIMTKCLLL